MLRALVDDTPESEAVRQQLLFEMLFNLKNTPEEKDWNILLDIYKQRAVAIAESNLLNSISQPNMSETKPEKIISVLERLDPDKWLRKSVGGRSKTKADKYAEILSAGSGELSS